MAIVIEGAFGTAALVFGTGLLAVHYLARPIGWKKNSGKTSLVSRNFYEVVQRQVLQPNYLITIIFSLNISPPDVICTM